MVGKFQEVVLTKFIGDPGLFVWEETLAYNQGFLLTPPVLE